MGTIFIGSGPSEEDARTAVLEIAAEAREAEAAEYARGLFEKQPFRGYELTDVLFAGARRAVFKGIDQAFERPVAVKVMKPWPGRESVVEEFFSLAGSIARLKCPGVARGLDAGRGDGDFFLVYEFLTGESLAARLARLQTGRMTEKSALKLVAETAGILQNLFDKGNPHGNLKPSNIVISSDGVPRLADIGFAWNLAWPTDEAAFLDNPEYLPPERLAGEFNIDIRGDLYSLGAIWFRAVMGRPVFLGETPAETLRMHLEEKAPALGTIDPKISAATSQLVRWLLEKDRANRPRTPREFLKKLAEHPLAAEATGALEEDGETDDEQVVEIGEAVVNAAESETQDSGTQSDYTEDFGT